jgi:pullulanase/glycogen debranching enzyme
VNETIKLIKPLISLKFIYSVIVSLNRMIKFGMVMCIRHEEKRNAYKVLVGKPEGKRQLGRTRRKWGNNNNKCQRNMTGWLDWIRLSQDRDQWGALVYTGMNLRFP